VLESFDPILKVGKRKSNRQNHSQRAVPRLVRSTGNVSGPDLDGDAPASAEGGGALPLAGLRFVRFWYSLSNSPLTGTYISLPGDKRINPLFNDFLFCVDVMV